MTSFSQGAVSTLGDRLERAVPSEQRAFESGADGYFKAAGIVELCSSWKDQYFARSGFGAGAVGFQMGMTIVAQRRVSSFP